MAPEPDTLTETSYLMGFSRAVTLVILMPELPDVGLTTMASAGEREECGPIDQVKLVFPFWVTWVDVQDIVILLLQLSWLLSMLLNGILGCLSTMSAEQFREANAILCSRWGKVRVSYGQVW
jgi:hypothetical protein